MKVVCQLDLRKAVFFRLIAGSGFPTKACCYHEAFPETLLPKLTALAGFASTTGFQYLPEVPEVVLLRLIALRFLLRLIPLRFWPAELLTFLVKKSPAAAS